jgi:hypothetical protein
MTTAIGPVTNGAVDVIEQSEPYAVAVHITGSADFLFHRWNCEAVEAKGKAAKGSSAKKSDDLESYVYRNDDGLLSIPGEYFRGAMIHAAKFRQDPRSPRKSAMDLFKAGIIAESALCELGTDKWDYEHKARVQVQRNGITRTRPAMKAGWTASLHLAVVLPEYIQPALLHDVLTTAGRLIGVGDYRPTYGRFHITKFERLAL